MKKQSGFTIIEALLALFILASSIYVLAGTQIRLVERVIRRSNEIDRIFFLKKEWYTAFTVPQLKKDKPIKRKIDQPEVAITTSVVKLKRSLIHPAQKHDDEHKPTDPLHMITSTGEWQLGVYKERLVLLGFIYAPHKKEGKKA